MHGNIWISELDNNPTACVLGFEGPDESSTQVVLTKEGAEATIGLLLEWLEYNEERMSDLFSDLEFLGQPEGESE